MKRRWRWQLVGGARSSVHLERHECLAFCNGVLLPGMLLLLEMRLIGWLALLLTELLLLLMELMMDLRALHVRVRGDGGDRNLIGRTALSVSVGGVRRRVNAQTRRRRGRWLRVRCV